MPFASFLSTRSSFSDALREVLGKVKSEWTGAIDVALCFFSPHHLPHAGAIASHLEKELNPKALIGCPGESIVGNGEEIENDPAFCLWLGRFPSSVQVKPFHLTVEQTSEGFSILGWPDEMVEGRGGEPTLILSLADPFTFPIDEFLTQINKGHAGLPVVGGMASGAHQPGINRLLLGGSEIAEGAACILFQGPSLCHSIVSQGCRPIGKPLVVTKSHHNLIQELGGKPALAQLQQLWQELTPGDQSLVQQGLHIGRVMSEYRESFQQGDFLVRNVMGIDRNTGAIAITDRIKAGTTIQFHVRDAASADQDLKILLEKGAKILAKNPAGALLFTCNGRGTRLFESPHHDAKMVQEIIGDIPLAGFFAQGELGPIAGQNFIHGFTASLLIFEEDAPSKESI